MNFDAVCRTCLATENLNPIYVKSFDPKRFSAAIFITTGLKVNIDDGLPQQMCARCITFSNDSLIFRKQCRDAQARLLQIKQDIGNRGDALSRHCDAVDTQLEMKTEEDIEGHDDNLAIKTEADDDDVSGNFNESQVQNINGGLTGMEVDTLQLQLAVEAGAGSEGSHSLPREGPSCPTSLPQQPELKSCIVKLVHLPMEDLGRLHTCETCLITFDDVLSLSNHSCVNSVEVNGDIRAEEVYDETAEVRFECDICGKDFAKREHVIKHLAGHNDKLYEDKLFQDFSGYFSTEDISPSDSSFQRLPDSKPVSTDDIEVLSVAEENSPSPMPAGGAAAAPERARACPGEGPGGRGSPEQRHGLRRCCVRLQRLPAGAGLMRDLTSDSELSFSHTTNNSTFNRESSEESASIKNIYYCDVCGKHYNQKRCLRRHIATHTGKKIYTCVDCKQTTTYPSQSTLQLTNSDSFSCRFCSGKLKLNFISRKQNSEKQMHTDQKPHCCDVCRKRFTHSSSLTRHKRIHTGEKPYSCDTCNKHFSWSSSLIAHKRIHTGEKPYRCDMCNKHFVKFNILIDHKRIHTGEKPYSCDTCNKHFAVLSTLSKHKRTHTSEKPYHCDTCNKRFSQSTNLIRHKRIHTGEKRYSCDICHKHFSDPSHLIRHKRIHTSKKPYSCDTCSKHFSQSSHLIRHKRIHTGEKQYSCDVCHKRFRTAGDLTLHKRIHSGERSYCCDVCGRSFGRKQTLSRHMLTHSGQNKS